MDRKAIAKRIKEQREALGFTQSGFCRAVNFSSQNMSFYETARRIPSGEKLVRLAKGLQVSTDYILGLSKEKS